MLVNVPQFIDVEDKIVGPLTAKQLGWIAAGGVVFLVLWGYLNTQALILTGIADAAIFGALAFYRPYNQSLFTFITSSISFVFRPKIYVWQKMSEKQKAESKKIIKKPDGAETTKKRDMERIKEISQMLDIRKK